MSNIWKTSVNELFTIFRGAMLAIIPWIEKAKIKWKEGESYDDWDNITDVLYENIVCSSLMGEIASSYPIAKYNFHCEDYSSIAFVEVRIKENPEKKFAFVAFQSSSSPLDCVKVAELDKMGKVVGYSNLKLDRLKFIFIKNINGKKEAIDSIDVKL